MIDGEKTAQESVLPGASPVASRPAPRGQVLVIFAGTFVVLLLMASLVIDLAWLWTNTLKIQRAADAAALAGVVQLPDQQATAYQLAINEAFKNGYDDADPDISVEPFQDALSKRRLQVRVTAPVKTFFLGLIGMDTVTVSRIAEAEFVLPVPMGSPENYYGVFGDVRGATFSTTGNVNVTDDTQNFDGNPNNAWDVAATQPSGNWTNPSRADGSNNNQFAVSTTANGSSQQWGDFSFGFNTPVISIDGIQVRMRADLTGSNSPTSNCRVDVALSSTGGAGATPWTTAARTTGPISTTESSFIVGGTSDLWGRTWTQGDFADGPTKFRVRLTWNKVSCGANRTVSIDTLEVNVVYTYQTTGTTTTTATYQLHGPGTPCDNGAPNCFKATPAGLGQVLNPRGFWATMNTEGAENINGDAYQPYYDRISGPTQVALNCPTSVLSACYGPDDYYNYAIEMPPNSTGGYVYVFDPVFCDTALNAGTGDRWFGGVGTPISSFYELYYDANNTPYNFADDPFWIPIDNTFRQIAASDSTMGGSGGSECRQSSTPYGDGRDYHNSWYLLNPGKAMVGGPSGTIYRLHTTGTELANPTQQRTANGEQSFAIYATSDQGIGGGAYPRVYGLGAMQMFTPLSASGPPTQSEFYLAQIDSVHKTKTLELKLWDPGDTNPLSGYVEVLIPCAPGTPVTVGNCPGGGWTAATVSYVAQTGTANSNRTNSCNNDSSSSTTTITTSTPTSRFNGCWVTISAVIPSWYTGGGGAATHDAWWKIRYTMSGNGTSSDVTTWTANIRGNPVHLIKP